jgi:hypothetical protein
MSVCGQIGSDIVRLASHELKKKGVRPDALAEIAAGIAMGVHAVSQEMNPNFAHVIIEMLKSPELGVK